MTRDDLSKAYRGYIACLNQQAWSDLDKFVDDAVQHNGRPIGLSGYRAMLETDFAEIPDLQFHIGLLICDPPHVASRLDFTCSPRGTYFGLPINGKRVSFTENVFYAFRDDRIGQVWSVIDTASIAAQL